MTDMECARRYSRAYLELCNGPREVELAVTEILRVRSMIESSADLKAFLSCAGIGILEKERTVVSLFSPVVSGGTMEFLSFTVTKGHGGLICDIAACCRDIYCHTQRSTGVVKACVPLDANAISRIKAHLEKKLHKKIDLSLEIDSGLIGGIQVLVDNVIIDGSIKRRLDELQEKLLTLKVN